MITTFKSPTDFRRSLEARLKNIAVKTGQDLQRIRRKVAFERLLAMFFQSESSGFVLKGGYAMELRIARARATKDIDLTCLRRVEDSDDVIAKVITEELRELAKEDFNDYFTFEIGEARIDLDNAPYGGARYSVASFLDKRLFVKFQLDVGADVITDEIELIDGWLAQYGIKTPKMRKISMKTLRINAFKIELQVKISKLEKNRFKKMKDVIG